MALTNRIIKGLEKVDESTQKQFPEFFVMFGNFLLREGKIKDEKLLSFCKKRLEGYTRMIVAMEEWARNR